jgi:undecaprenyl-diphosphatase
VSILEAIVLGVVQGLTEFLPISSTAHLRLVPAFAGWPDPGAAFTAITQLGTVLAVLIYFRADLVRIARTWFLSLREPSLRSELDARMGWYLIIATIPIAIVGLLFENQIETEARDLYLIGGALIALGLLLQMAEIVAPHTRGLDRVSRRDAVVVGLAQVLALVPGVSRSGATITAGLFLGLEREAAARFSFLLSVPAVVLSGLYQGVSLYNEPGDSGALALIVATLFAFVAGYAAIAFLLRFLATHTTEVFVVYRVVLGTVVIVLAAAGVIS